MRHPIAEPRQTQNALMTRGTPGTLDVAFGPSFARFNGGQATFPEDPVEYRIVRIAPQTAP